jgi:hypothetical protein
MTSSRAAKRVQFREEERVLAIVYMWGYGPPAPERIGNATRQSGLAYADEAIAAARSAGFDIERLNADGRPAWAAAYNTAEYVDAEIAFDPGEDGDLFEGHEEVR